MEFIKENNRIYIENESKQVIAEVTFPELKENVVNLNHTFVDGSLRGQGVAGKLVEAAAIEVRQNNKKLIPTCSYAVHWFETHKEYEDIIYKK